MTTSIVCSRQRRRKDIERLASTREKRTRDFVDIKCIKSKDNKISVKDNEIKKDRRVL